MKVFEYMFYKYFFFLCQPDLLNDFFTKQDVAETVAAVKELKIPKRLVTLLLVVNYSAPSSLKF